MKRWLAVLWCGWMGAAPNARGARHRRNEVRAPAAAAARSVSKGPAPERPRVAYVIGKRAYLNRGREEGLAVGNELSLTLRGKPSGTCRVASVADHVAICEGAGVRVGASFAARPIVPVRPLAARVVASPAELTRRRCTIQAVSLPLADFRAAASAGGPRGFTADARFTDWSWIDGPSHFHQERLDLAIRGVPIGLGLRLFVDATALAWTTRPTAFMSPLTATDQLFVREVEVSSRDPGQRLTFALGRIWPWYTPGIAAVDGAQVGLRGADGSWEVGAFGGGIPDAITTAPTFQRTAVGGYYSGRWGEGASAFTHEARVSLMTAPEYGARVEAEERVRGWFFRVLDVGADVRFGVGGAQAPAAVDVARLDANWRIASFLGLNGGVRYSGNDALDIATIGAATTGTRSLHSDLALVCTPIAGFSVSAVGITARDISSALTRAMVGGEVGLPMMWGTFGGMGLGWLEERGWVSGRDVYLQATLQPGRLVRLLARLSYSQELPYGIAGAPPIEDATAYVSTEFSPFRWLSFHVAASGRLDLSGTLSGSSALNPLTGPSALVVQAGVTGSL